MPSGVAAAAAGAALAAVVATLAPGAGGARRLASAGGVSYGFVTSARASIERVSCATGLAVAADHVLLCAWPSSACSRSAVSARCYDRRAVIELLPSGRTRTLRPGSDLLLDIDGDDPHDRDAAAGASGTRPLLRTGTVWRRSGFRCVRGAAGLTCTAHGHGFTLTPHRKRVF